MKNAAKIVFRIEKIFAIIGIASLAVCFLVGIVLGVAFLETVFTYVKENVDNIPANITLEVFAGIYWGALIGSMVVAIPLVIVELIVCNVAVRKIDTCKNKNEMITIGVLNCIFGWKVPGIFIFVSKPREWNNQIVE